MNVYNIIVVEDGRSPEGTMTHINSKFTGIGAHIFVDGPQVDSKSI